MATSEMTTFISLFHSSERAEDALSALESAGFNRSAVTSTWKGETGAENTDTTGELTRIGVPSRDLKHLRDGIENGGVVISLEAPESRSDDIERIFHKFTADKIDETNIDRGAIAEEPFVARPMALDVTENAVIPLAAEELLVGKREVDRGGVRVFRRTIEEPVSEAVSLHEEHVVVDRRMVDRAVTDADFANADKTIELTETDEIPVVAKTARVVEEVRIGKVESDRTETVRDTVRHTEVDVEQIENDTRLGNTAPNLNKTGGTY